MAHNLPNSLIFPLPKFSHVWYIILAPKVFSVITVNSQKCNTNDMLLNNTRFIVMIVMFVAGSHGY